MLIFKKNRIGTVSLKYRKELAANTEGLVCMRLIKRLVGKAVKVEILYIASVTVQRIITIIM